MVIPFKFKAKNTETGKFENRQTHKLNKFIFKSIKY